MTDSILGLVDELVLIVVDQIDDVKTLLNLAQTCRRLHDLTEPAIYRNVFIKSQRAGRNLLDSIVSRPVERLQAILHLELRYRSVPGESRFNTFAHVLAIADNVREYILESPFCRNQLWRENDEWTDTMATLLQSVCDFSWGRLTKLTLHWSSQHRRYWAVTAENVSIFAHPTLKHLKVSCATLADDVAPLLHDERTTPLTHLAFISCFITHKALNGILALPAALEVLSLGENLYNYFEPIENSTRLFTRNPIAFFDSLKQQQQSLRESAYASTAEYHAPRLNFRLPPHDPHDFTGFSTFHQLRQISLEECCIEFRHIFELPHLAPPALQRLNMMEFDFGQFFHFGRPANSIDDAEAESVPWIVPTYVSLRALPLIQLMCEEYTTPLPAELLSELKDVQRDGDAEVLCYRRFLFQRRPPFLYGDHGYQYTLMYVVASGQITTPPEPYSTFGDEAGVVRTPEYS